MSTTEKSKMENYSLFQNIAKLSPDAGVILLVRHSIRHPIPEGSIGNEVGLTPEGAELATKLGKSIKHTIESAYSSPIQRCIDTAQSIIAGNRVSAEIKTSKILGDPGIFVEDEQTAIESFFSIWNFRDC